MKPFDLQEALNGAPVKLRNGNKAMLYYRVPDCYTHEDGVKITYPLIGMIFDKNNMVCDPCAMWKNDGKFTAGRCQKDIVGMWEEPELTSEQVLEKAYQEDLKVSLDGQDVYIIIGKAKDGSYLLGSEESDSYVAWSVDFGRPEIYLDALAQKSNTITVTLPKPFKPKSSDKYYHFVLDYKKYRISEEVFGGFNAEVILAGNGLCFRAREDAKAWLDAMKNALDD